MDVFVAILLSFSLVSGFDYQRRCLFHKKSCVSRCPNMMHPYHTRCDRDTVSQRTCTSPYVYPIGYTCGWSRCDCNGDLLLDEETNDCVPHEMCPVHSKKSLKRRRKKKTYRVPKNMGNRVISEGDLIDLA